MKKNQSIFLLFAIATVFFYSSVSAKKDTLSDYTALIVDLNRSEGIDVKKMSSEMKKRRYPDVNEKFYCMWPTDGDGIITDANGNLITSFDQLKKMDINGDGVIHSSEAQFKVWVDDGNAILKKKKELKTPGRLKLSTIFFPKGTSKTGIAHFSDGNEGHVMELEMCKAK